MKAPFPALLVVATAVVISALSLGATAVAAEPIPETMKASRAWWKEAVVYQIYPRSFKDSNGDGVGDLQGIIQKLDYIKSLGVDVVWLNPIFASPNDDNGYDVSDYTSIMPEFGTMADFDRLLRGMHERGLKLVLDLVANHSSDEHEWFKQSRSSRTNPYRDYYHWWDAERGPPPKRWSFFDVDSNAWAYDQKTNAYYLHYFSRKQPDLNWENPKVRQEIYQIMRFWLDKGVDGFRMDVIGFISKDDAFPALPAKNPDEFIARYAQGPHLHDYLQEMNREVLSRYDVMTVGEGAGVTIDQAMKFVDPARRELNMMYYFEGISLGYLPGEWGVPDPKGYSLVDFKKLYSRWNDVFAERGWGTIYLGNHDQPRMVTRWGDDRPQFRELSSKMLTTFLLTMRATPYYYAGDELGMTNIRFERIEDYRDIDSINRYRHLKEQGGDLKSFLENQKLTARDNGRTPFQWNGEPQGGFTTGIPWLQVNPNYRVLNAAIQERDPLSPLNYFRTLTKLRKAEPALVYGDYALIDKDNAEVYAYTRQLGQDRFLILLNFRPHDARVDLAGLALKSPERIAGNYPAPSASIASLRPYEAAIYRISH